MEQKSVQRTNTRADVIWTGISSLIIGIALSGLFWMVMPDEPVSAMGKFWSFWMTTAIFGGLTYLVISWVDSRRNR
jgi:polyferredoxin